MLTSLWVAGYCLEPEQAFGSLKNSANCSIQTCTCKSKCRMQCFLYRTYYTVTIDINKSCLLALTGQPCCYPVLFGPLMMNLALSWLQLWNQEEAHSYHHGQTSGLEASLQYHLHQRQLKSCGTMDQPDNIYRCISQHFQ